VMIILLIITAVLGKFVHVAPLIENMRRHRQTAFHTDTFRQKNISSTVYTIHPYSKLYTAKFLQIVHILWVRTSLL
jgi:hypothetical protein